VDVGGAQQIRHPVRYRNASPQPPTPPPPLGEHDALVRAWLTGPADAPIRVTTPER
jgi:formyl-CoA transferase